jgi:Fe2+ transport system protein B
MIAATMPYLYSSISDRMYMDVQLQEPKVVIHEIPGLYERLRPHVPSVVGTGFDIIAPDGRRRRDVLIKLWRIIKALGRAVRKTVHVAQLLVMVIVSVFYFTCILTFVMWWENNRRPLALAIITLYVLAICR